jgi:hypothetical protein
MQRDFMFFVSGVPDEMLIRDTHYIFVPVPDTIRKAISQLAERYVDIKHPLEIAKGKYSLAIFRNKHVVEGDAFEDAFQRLSGILDAYSLLTEDNPPDVWPLVQIRDADQQDAKLKFFVNHGWARLSTTDGNAEREWQGRTNQLLQRFLVFFDLIANDDPKWQTELADQLNLSARMYRHGRTASAFGIDFLCKFTALEGLVCGPEQNGKKRLLTERLSSLFRNRKEIETEIAELWNMRCEASHQGKAFSQKFATSIGWVESLVLGTVIFALDHVTTVSTVEQLWLRASSYTLPKEVTAERPAEIMRVSIAGGSFETSLKCNDVGRFLDQFFQSKPSVSAVETPKSTT